MPHPVNKLLLAGLILTSTHLYAEDYDFTPGLWEITTKSEPTLIEATPEMKQMLENAGGVKPSTFTHKECIENFDLLDDADGDDDDEKCQENVKRINANQVTFESNCTSAEGKSHSTGEYYLHGKTFTIKQEIESYSDSMSSKVTMTGTGKYLGPCD